MVIQAVMEVAVKVEAQALHQQAERLTQVAVVEVLGLALECLVAQA
jgi:hypothetical protein